MKKPLLLGILSLATALLLSSCAFGPKDGEIVQAGWFDTFAAGDFKGFESLGDVASGADIGLGTFPGVDGELIILDGVCYKASADGYVTTANGKTKTPFAMAANVKPEMKIIMKKGMSVAEFTATIDKAAPQACFLAIKAHGTFAKLKLRAPPPANEPYPTLAEVISKQKIFEVKNITGTLVGFRTPAACSGMNVPGYHFHFISDDHKKGGHVLEFNVDDVSADVQRCATIKLLLQPNVRSAKLWSGTSIPGETAGH